MSRVAEGSVPGVVRPESPAARIPPRSRVQVVLAVLLGLLVPATGFHPANQAAGRLELTDVPWRVVAMPSVLVAAFAVAAALLFPMRRPPLPAWVRLGLASLLLGGALSCLNSDDATASALQVVTGLWAPTVTFVAVRSSALPRRALAGALLVGSTLLLLRADVVFFNDYGLPSGQDLFDAKFSNQPYDFHYYALQNPDHTAAFVLLLLPLAAWWAVGEERPWARVALWVDTGILLGTVVLLYVRSAVLAAVVVTLWAVWRSGLSQQLRIFGAALAGLVVVAVPVLDASVRQYLGAATDTSSTASGVVRLDSIGTGIDRIIGHPLTGQGLGWSERAPALRVPAHSSVFQAGVEMGLFGFAGCALLTVWMFSLGVRTTKTGRRGGLRKGAGVAVAVYAGYVLVASGAIAGFANGFVAVWGMTLAIVLVLAHPETAGGSRDGD